MRKIWKHQFDPAHLNMGRVVVNLPPDYKIKHVHEQGGYVCMWFETFGDYVEKEYESFAFALVGTGFDLPWNLNDHTWTYIGTAHVKINNHYGDFDIVAHLYGETHVYH